MMNFHENLYLFSFVYTFRRFFSFQYHKKNKNEMRKQMHNSTKKKVSF